MTVFICNDHDGHYPVGVASVVIAEDENQARTLLKEALSKEGLNAELPFTLTEIGLVPRAIVICNGDY